MPLDVASLLEFDRLMSEDAATTATGNMTDVATKKARSMIRRWKPEEIGRAIKSASKQYGVKEEDITAELEKLLKREPQ